MSGLLPGVASVMPPILRFRVAVPFGEIKVDLTFVVVL